MKKLNQLLFSLMMTATALSSFKADETAGYEDEYTEEEQGMSTKVKAIVGGVVLIVGAAAGGTVWYYWNKDETKKNNKKTKTSTKSQNNDDNKKKRGTKKQVNVGSQEDDPNLSD